MAKRKRPKTTPISIRLTAEEKTRLETDAGCRSLSDHVRAKVLGETAKTRNTKTPTTNARQLAHVLAALGQSDLAPSLRELLSAVRVGALPVTPETECAIQAACQATLQIRATLMSALGLKEGGTP